MTEYINGIKAKAAKFSRDFYGYLLHIISGNPACIMGFENTGTPYSEEIYRLFEDKHPDIKLSEISVSDGKITGFKKECVQNRKIIFITENPRDRGALYATDLARKYMNLKGPYNIRGMTIITVDPFEIRAAEQFLRKGFI